MGHTLTLEVPDEVYNPLLKTAEQTGQNPEELAIQWLAAVVETFSAEGLINHGTANDPLEEFIGAFKSDIPDWADQHDKHLGQSSAEALRMEAKPRPADDGTAMEEMPP